jgi:hypothetical protein
MVAPSAASKDFEWTRAPCTQHKFQRQDIPPHNDADERQPNWHFKTYQGAAAVYQPAFADSSTQVDFLGTGTQFPFLTASSRLQVQSQISNQPELYHTTLAHNLPPIHDGGKAVSVPTGELQWTSPMDIDLNETPSPSQLPSLNEPREYDVAFSSASFGDLAQQLELGLDYMDWTVPRSQYGTSDFSEYMEANHCKTSSLSN